MAKRKAENKEVRDVILVKIQQKVVEEDRRNSVYGG
jgi:hypothetical protein